MDHGYILFTVGILYFHLAIGAVCWLLNEQLEEMYSEKYFKNSKDESELCRPMYAVNVILHLLSL